MINYCVGCGEEHDYFNWKFKDYEDRYGQKQSGWFCGLFFKLTKKEWIPDYIKEDRKKHFKDTLQPWRDGEPSREYMDAYPERAKKRFTEKERRKAKNVWRDIAPAKFKKGTK